MNEDFSLRPDEIALIRPFLHDRLRRVISQGQPVHKRSYDQFSQPVQLEFDGGAFQVYNDFVVANYFDDKEDCGRMSIVSPEEIPDPEFVMEIDRPVKNILLATNRIRFSESGESELPTFEFIYPRALIICFDAFVLTIERGWHFMPDLNVQKHVGIPHTFLTGELFDWYNPESDDVCPDFQQTIVPISHLKIEK